MLHVRSQTNEKFFFGFYGYAEMVLNNMWE